MLRNAWWTFPPMNSFNWLVSRMWEEDRTAYSPDRKENVSEADERKSRVTTIIMDNIS